MSTCRVQCPVDMQVKEPASLAHQLLGPCGLAAVVGDGHGAWAAPAAATRVLRWSMMLAFSKLGSACEASEQEVHTHAVQALAEGRRSDTSLGCQTCAVVWLGYTWRDCSMQRLWSSGPHSQVGGCRRYRAALGQIRSRLGRSRASA